MASSPEEVPSSNSEDAPCKMMRTWEEQFDQLVSYKRAKGDCLVPNIYPEDTSLGYWVRSQRGRRYSMSEQKRNSLDSIGFVWDAKEHSWDLMRSKLQDHSRANVGTIVIPEDDIKMQRWVASQRLKYKQGALSISRQKKLQSIAGFAWDTEQSQRSCTTFSHQSPGQQEEIWNKTFQRLISFKEEHGHVLVPYSYEQDRALGMWVSRQRHLHFHNKLPAYRQVQLVQVGFVWNVQKDRDDQEWQHMLQAAIAHQSESRLLGRSKSCSSCSESPYTKLHNWMTTQRQAYEAHTLNADREAQLKNIGFNFEGPLPGAGAICIQCKCKIQGQSPGHSGALDKLQPIVAALQGLDEDFMENCAKSLEKMLQHERPEWNPDPIGICSAKAHDQVLNLVLEMDRVLDTSERSLFFLHKCELLLEQYSQLKMKSDANTSHAYQERRWCPRSDVENILPASPFSKLWMERLESQPFFLSDIKDDADYSSDSPSTEQRMGSDDGEDYDSDSNDDDDENAEPWSGELGDQLETSSEESSCESIDGTNEESEDYCGDCSGSVQSDLI